jgi:TRAP-type C4-dicarboxylate transport system permease small subunit
MKSGQPNKTTMRKAIDSLLSKMLITIMAAMAVNVLWQVFSRYFMETPSSFTDELARYLMIWLGILGAAYVAGKNGHVAIDVLPSRLSPKAQKRLRQVVRLAIVLFCFFAMFLGGIRLVYITYILEQYSAALEVPLALVYAVIPLSGLLIIYYKITELVQE